MASNNNTEVVNGVVQPRFYQVYGDLIESKEIMEPLSINAGTGPICGFDWVDTSKTSVTITSIFKSNSGAKGLSMLKGKSRRVFLSDKNNNAGQVFNAYTTPDGLCHIAPDTLTFNGMQPEGGWPSTTNPTKLVAFVVKASHTYKPNNSENPPSLANFICNWLTLDSKTYLSTILKWNYEEVLQAISKSGISFDPNTETIIGIYLVGWNTSWNEDTESVRLKAIISDFNYILCLVPAGGKYPVAPFGLHPLDILDIKSRVSSLESRVIQVDTLNRYLTTQMNSQGKGIEIEYTVKSEEDNDTYTFTKLIINGCKLATSDKPVKKTIGYQWRESSIGILIYTTSPILENISLSDSQWGIKMAEPQVSYDSVVWDGSIDTGSLSDGMIPVAIFELNSFNSLGNILPNHGYSLLNNSKVDGLTRLALGLNRYILQEGTTLSFEDTQTLKYDRSTSAELVIKANYSQGVFNLDLLCKLNQGVSEFSDRSIDVKQLLISDDSRWEDILKAVTKKYGDIYGYYQNYGEPSSDIYSSLNVQLGYTSSSNYYLYVYAKGKTTSSTGGTFGYKMNLSFIIDTQNLVKTPNNPVNLIQACISNPFKTSY